MSAIGREEPGGGLGKGGGRVTSERVKFGKQMKSPSCAYSGLFQQISGRTWGLAPEKPSNRCELHQCATVKQLPRDLLPFSSVPQNKPKPVPDW